MNISLSLCLSFFTSPCLHPLTFRVFHMGSLYVLTSKSDHLHDLECVCCWFSSLLFCRSCTQASLFVVCFSLYPLSWDNWRNISIAFLRINNAYGFLTRYIFFCLCLLFLSHRERIHSAPLLRFSGPLEPSRHRCEFIADVPANRTNTSGPLHTVIDTSNTTEIDVSVTVSRRDF